MTFKQIQVNTQSSIRIEGAKVIYFDPFRIGAETHDADFIVITHSHYDHFDPVSIKKVRKKDTVFIAPSGMESEIKEITSGERLKLMFPGDILQLTGLTITAVPAYNKLKPFHPKHNKWLGYVLEMDGIRYYIAGDTDAVKELHDVKCDVAMVPIRGTYTMNARDAAGLINEIRPAAVIPTHYGSIVGNPGDVEAFSKWVDSDISVLLKLGVI